MESDFVLLGLPKDNIRDFGSYPGPMWVNKLYIFLIIFMERQIFLLREETQRKAICPLVHSPNGHNGLS